MNDQDTRPGVARIAPAIDLASNAYRDLVAAVEDYHRSGVEEQIAARCLYDAATLTSKALRLLRQQRRRMAEEKGGGA